MIYLQNQRFCENYRSNVLHWNVMQFSSAKHGLLSIVHTILLLSSWVKHDFISIYQVMSNCFFCNSAFRSFAQRITRYLLLTENDDTHLISYCNLIFYSPGAVNNYINWRLSSLSELTSMISNMGVGGLQFLSFCFISFI